MHVPPPWAKMTIVPHRMIVDVAIVDGAAVPGSAFDAAVAAGFANVAEDEVDY